MKLITVLAAFAATTSALVIQVDIKEQELLSPICLPPGRKCTKDKQCCSKHCYYLNRPYGFCGADDDDDETCRVNGSICTRKEDCCSDNCEISELVGQCRPAEDDNELSKTALPEKLRVPIPPLEHQACRPNGYICTKNKNCCSGNCKASDLIKICSPANDDDELSKTAPPKKLQFPIPPLEHQACLPLGRKCIEDEQCCSQHCYYLNRPYGFCGRSNDEDEPCRPEKSFCMDNKDCCSGKCRLIDLGGYCDPSDDDDDNVLARKTRVHLGL